MSEKLLKAKARAFVFCVANFGLSKNSAEYQNIYSNVTSEMTPQEKAFFDKRIK